MVRPKDLREELEPPLSTVTIVFEHCLCRCQNMQRPAKSIYRGVAMKGQANTRTPDAGHYVMALRFAISLASLSPCRLPLFLHLC